VVGAFSFLHLRFQSHGSVSWFFPVSNQSSNSHISQIKLLWLIPGCPSYLFVLPEIIDNSQTLHYSLEHYGNYNFINFCVNFVDFDEKKSSH